MWGGDSACNHVWETGERRQIEIFAKGKSVNGSNRVGSHSNPRQQGILEKEDAYSGDTCTECGAWKGELGSEPTPEMFISHLVSIFAEVKRVMRNDATCFINITDSYNNKHLQLIPQELAIALKRDGWYIRSVFPWIKANSLPESAKDRPSTANETIIMATKNARYFYDGDAVRLPQKDFVSSPHIKPKNANQGDSISVGAGNKQGGFNAYRQSNGIEYNPLGRNRRTSDSINETLDVAIEHHQTELARLQGIKAKGGLLTDADGMPEAIFVNPKPLKDLHYACVDEETDALTLTGWKRGSDLVDGDLIAVYDTNTKTVRWEAAQFHRYDYDGLMISIEKRNTSQKLTPNHRCLYKSMYGHVGVCKAIDLKATYKLPLAAEFSDAGITNSIGLDWASLLGWYITEGYYDKAGKVAIIYQSESANPEKVKTIDALLSRMGAKCKRKRRCREYKGRDSIQIEWRIKGSVRNWLRHYAPEKKMTPFLAMLTPNEGQALLDALIAGDGTTRQTKSGQRHTLFQKDRESIELMQFLATRLGFSTQLTKRKGSTYALYINNKKWVTLRSANGVCDGLPMAHYRGLVWCAVTPTGFWLARRRGIPFITGNSYPPGLIAPFILTSPKRCCRVCGKGWESQTDAGLIKMRPSAGNDSRTRGDDRLTTARGHNGWQGTNLRRVVTPTGIFPACACESPHTMIDGYCSDCGANTFLRDAEPCWKPATVLDPFLGSGTTAIVAAELGRDCIGIELKPEYLEMARQRIDNAVGLIASTDAVLASPETIQAGGIPGE